MAEKGADAKDVADMLEAIAKRIRSEPGAAGAPAGRATLPVVPVLDLLDEAPSLGALDVFHDKDAITVTVETRNTDARGVQVSLLQGRLVIHLGQGADAYRRDLPLPAAVDEDAAVATFRNGILDVVLPLRHD